MTNEDLTTFSIIEKEGSSSIMSKCLQVLKDFIQQNKDREDIGIVNLFIEALKIFNKDEGSNFTQLNLHQHRTYLTEKERIRLELATQNEGLINLSSLITTQKKNNLELMTTRTKELETGLSK